jgi:RNA polymerase sigma-70 factor (ECF subfamily)
VRARDTRAWERLVSLYTPLLEQWCRQYGLQEADAADVCQKVFMAVAESIGTFRRDEAGGSFRGWLRTITRTKVLDHRRREAPKAAPGGNAYEQQLHMPAPEPEEPGAGVENEEIRLLYRRAMELMGRDFEETTWRAFFMVVVEDRSPADAAAELGISRNAVYLARARVLSRLREEFADLLDT